MAQKKIDIKFDLDSKSVKIAGEDTMKLTQQVRLLKEELASGKYSQEEFDMLSNKLDNVQERMEGARARSGDLLTSLQLIPGPIGEIASKFNGAISVLQQFSKFSFADLQTQFKKTVDDIKDIGSALLKNTGISAAYDLVNTKLTATFVGLGVSEQFAATGARALSVALAATGIGLLVVALGSAVSLLMEFATGSDEAAAAQARLSKELETTNKLLEMDLADAQRRQKIRIAEMKRDGKSESDIRAQGLADLKENLALTEKALAENRATESKVLRTGEGELKEVYAAQATLEEKREQLIADIREKEINNEIEANKDRETQRQKNAQSRERANAKELKDEQDRQRKLDEARAINREAELSLMDAYDREVAERTDRFTKEVNKLKEAGFVEGSQELKNLQEEFNLDIGVIDEKYLNERKQRQLEISNQLKAIQASTTETVLDDAQVQIDIANHKYDELRKAAIRNGEDTKNIELLRVAEIEKIQKDAAEKEINRVAEDAMKLNDKKLRLLELEGQSLIQGTQTYAENRAEILRLTEQQELIELKRLFDLEKLTREEYEQSVTAVTAKYAKQREDLRKREVQTTIQQVSQILSEVGNIASQLASLYDEESKTSKAAFEKRKKLQIASSLIGGAAAIVNVLAAPPVGNVVLDGILKGLRIGAVALQTGIQIKKIRETTFEGGGSDKTESTTAAAKPTGVVARRAQGGFIYGDGGSMTDSIPAMLSNGEFVMNAKSAAMFSPMLTAMNNMGNLPNTSVPQSLGNQSLVDVMSQSVNNRPIKTYVTAQDMSNQQQFDRTIKSRSLI